MKKLEFKGVKFLIVVIVLYAVVLIVDFENSLNALKIGLNILGKLIPVFTFVIILTALVNYLLKPKQIMKHFGKDSGMKGIIYAILGGVLSHGPMYAWYGMLSEMKSHGLKSSLIAIFMYARAVKLPLLPFMIDVFGITFTIIINIYILVFAVLQGQLMDKLMNLKK